MLIFLGIFLLILFILEPPLFGIFNLIILGFFILMLFSIKSKKKTNNYFSKKRIFIYTFLLIITLLNFLLPKLQIQEAHSIFINKKDIKVISNFVSKSIITNIENDYRFFNINKFLNAAGDLSINEFETRSYVNKEFAYSTDSFFKENKYSRVVESIDFYSRETLRLDHLNSTEFNLLYDKKFRRQLPYYVFYEIPSLANSSKLCGKGNIYYHFSKTEIKKNNLSNTKFNKLQNECLTFDKKYNFLYVVGYSINSDTENELEIKLIKNLKLIFLEIFDKITKILLILFTILFFYKIKFGEHTYVYLLSFLSTIIICFLKDPNLITGLRYFRGGADGLNYYSLGKYILSNLNSGQISKALEGGADVFYFMPGQRYFVALSNMIFGANSYGYILISSLLPISIYIFIKNYINLNYAKIFFFLFIFLPIFENLGFGYFNYVHQVYRNHGETLSILLIILTLIYILKLEKNLYFYENLILIFFIGIILSISATIRPNFVLTTNLLYLYCLYLFYCKNNFKAILSITAGYLFVFLSAIHNYYFGQEFVLFTSAFVSMNFPIDINTYLVGFYNLLILNFENTELQNMINHLNRWNPLYNFHRLLIIFIILYFIITRKNKNFNYLIFFCMFAQQFLLLLSNPDSRYAYLAWLLTFLLFIKILHQENLILKILKQYKNIKYKLFPT
tara:strand:+ start:1225 stop:3258 length:2034 start_codon:yes stop_codon:yes gene_type:complete